MGGGLFLKNVVIFPNKYNYTEIRNSFIIPNNFLFIFYEINPSLFLYH